MDETKEVLQSAVIELQKSAQKEVEFSRYKQDCRKRALDMAMMNGGAINLSLATNPAPDDILLTAEFYYKWLTAEL